MFDTGICNFLNFLKSPKCETQRFISTNEIRKIHQPTIPYVRCSVQVLLLYCLISVVVAFVVSHDFTYVCTYLRTYLCLFFKIVTNTTSTLVVILSCTVPYRTTQSTVVFGFCFVEKNESREIRQSKNNMYRYVRRYPYYAYWYQSK